MKREPDGTSGSPIGIFNYEGKFMKKYSSLSTPIS